MTEDYLLQLSTEQPKRKKIKIDDVDYEVAVPEDFELEEFLELANSGTEAGELVTGKKISPERIKKLTGLLDMVTKRAIPDLPDEVFKKLRPIQKFAIVNVFSGEVSGKLRGPASPDPSHGQSSSLDSSDSMEEQSKAG